ncbi:Peptidoglycan N-acetylglucosamine deacetylase [Streptococcus sp. DD10]|uniref:polysaccharide deacetylase family protein n=1 Tax=Streptococcus sp. DD10 TaxID=1777878 RepID=UPI0007911464|nr:polysaccharide deacetylase family protein [Streptococcus sp. DD10]KXT77067.1 Peptidoglycan N-acetylglucosamine deacetylase [Streptococcus sp. DD10]
MKTQLEKNLVLLFINLLCVALILFLGERVYYQFQEQNYQLKLHHAIQDGKTLTIAQNSTEHAGWIGDKYVTAYYPRMGTTEYEVVKSRIDAETMALQVAQPELADELREIIFYGSEEGSSELVNLKQVSIQKVLHKIDNRKIGSAEKETISSLYLNADGQEITLANLFINPELAKSSMENFIHQQLIFRGLSEDQVQETIRALESQELSQWQFSYRDATFAIKLPNATAGVLNIDVPLSELYNTIDSTYLQGQDLEKYQAYEEQRHKKAVALTFDDGPNATTTPQALDILKKYHAKATFFMVGKAIAGNEAIVQRVLKEGHGIGNHTWNHPVLTKISLDQAVEEINSTTVALQKAGVQEVHLMRPPYGAISPSIQSAVDQSFIMWDIDSLDWKTHNTAAIMEEVKKTQPGSIILLHDIHQTTIDALPTIIQYLKDQGFELVTVDELMGKGLENHKLYYSRN